MAEHYRLYYIFLEEQAQNPIPPPRKIQIEKNLKNFYEKIKPSQQEKPLTVVNTQNQTETRK